MSRATSSAAGSKPARLLAAGLALGIAALVLYQLVSTFLVDPRVGQDFRFYREVGQRWLETGQLYLPRQLSGAYQLELMVDVLYPPTALLLFVPLALLPDGVDAVVWWGVPAAILARQIALQRPAPWTWPLAALLLLWPRSYGSVLWGNTDLWAVAAVSGGLQWGWPALLVTLKPSFAIFSLVGIRRRSWWLAAVLLGAFALLTLPLWSDYVRAMASARGLGIDYSLFNLPIATIPLVLYLGRRRRASRDAGAGGPASEAAGAPRATAPAEPA